MESPNDSLPCFTIRAYMCTVVVVEACLHCTCVDKMLIGSMYDTHANEDICDFKRGVCHESVILTIGLADFFTGFLYLLFCESQTNGLAAFFIGLFSFL